MVNVPSHKRPVSTNVEKPCKVCHQVKPLEEFYAAPGMRDGHRNDCKSCNLAATRARVARDPGANRARVREWQVANRERVNAASRERRKRPEAKRAQRDGYLRRKYGITIKEYDEMFRAQNGVCGICGREPHPTISLHVDHDHETGKVRGLTCFRCNQALGAFGEDPTFLRAAAAYLDRHDPEVVACRERTLARVRALPPPVWEQSA